MNQEDILQYIQKQKWEPVLSFLHKRKEDIKTDTLLQFATTIFESEFFLKLKGDNPTILLKHLEDLYQLHRGDFFILKEQIYLDLVRELAKKNKGEQAYNYANLFPEDPICKKIIENTNEEFKTSHLNTKSPINKACWIEIYNRLFEAINNQGNQSTYISGPRFINILKEFSPYHPDYNQYLELRYQQGKSTSRKIFYYDILLEQTDAIKIKFVNRILSIIQPFDPIRANAVKTLLDGGKLINPITTRGDNTQKVFISYSWDDEEHQKWVFNLAEKLKAKNIEVIFDRYALKFGSHLTYFAENSIRKADRVIVIFTPNYKARAEKREGGVGFEYSIITNIMYNNQMDERLIPIIRNGSKQECIPDFMQQYIHLDMSKDEHFDTSFADLIRDLNNSPE